MSTTGSDEAETMHGAFQLGYTRQQIVKSIVLALVLHGAIVGAYLVLGSEKKPPQGKVAAKAEKKDGEDANAASKSPEAKAETPKSGEPATAATTSEASKTPAKAKGAEASKASELPAAPDSDIDAILKAK